MSGFKVVTEAVRVEAGVWRTFSDRIEKVRDNVRDLRLDYTAFFAGDLSTLGVVGTGLRADAYEDFREAVEKLLDGAVTEFEEFGNALKRIAATYDAADEDPRFDPAKFRLPLDEIFG